MTAIAWSEKRWNPIVGCSVVSPGCTHCNAMRRKNDEHLAAALGAQRQGHNWRCDCPLGCGYALSLADGESGLNSTRLFAESSSHRSIK